MIQIDQIKKKTLYFLTFIIILCSMLLCSNRTVHAMKVSYYSYDKIYKALPSKYQDAEYIYKSEGIPLISFATYNGASDYKTSVKKNSSSSNFLYCMDFSKHMIFNKNFSEKNQLFNDELRARIGIALYLGTTEWGKKANSSFTTGNAILDYYMTQLVIHSLIYNFGGNKSNYGISFDLLQFKSGTGNLSKKSKQLLEYCCNVPLTLKDGNFQAIVFSFKELSSNQLFIDGDYLTSPIIECHTDKNNAEVESYERNVNIHGLDSDVCRIEQTSDRYDSQFKVQIPVSEINQLPPGRHIVDVVENVNFKKAIAGFWNCSDKEFANSNQEIGGMLYKHNEISDVSYLEFLIGEAVLFKRDSITGETITDAAFQILQFDDRLGEYVYYKDLSYDADEHCYKSGNLCQTVNNKNGKFKIIESQPGKNYINDWQGEEFQIAPGHYSFEFNVENQPKLGKLHLYKEGENAVFTESRFQKTDNISLKGIKFALYAKEDIYLKGKLFYGKDQKIADLITDETGEIHVSNLIEGEYYLKEEETSSLHILNKDVFYFSILKDDNNKYNEITYSLVNFLKKCEIQIYKYYYDSKDENQRHKKPLLNAKFGLYAGQDFLDCNGNLIVKKDSLIKEGYSGKDGMLSFENLLYGEYYIKELEAPDGYILNDGIVTIAKEDFVLSDKENTIYYAKKEIINEEQLFKIKLTKYGEIFSGFKKEQNENGEYFSYQLDKKPLGNIQFTIYDKDSNALATQSTDNDGVLYFQNLKQGKYYCIEDSCPEEYLKEFVKKEIICKAIDKDNFPIVSQPVTEETVYNELCSCSVSIYKLGENAYVEKNKISYKQIPLEGVVFGIYQDFDYNFPSGEKLSKDSCIGYLVTNQEGRAEYTGKMPVGTYYIKEVKAKAGYEIDNKKYSFVVEPQKNQEIKINFSDSPFLNKLLKASVKIIKTDSNTHKPLKNVEFTLYNDQKKEIGVYRTDRKGRIVVKNLPYGSYYFVETKCKNGYYSTNNKYKFSLQSKDMVTLNITNSPILKLGFEEHYKIGLIGTFLIIFCILIFGVLGNIKKHGNKSS